MKTIEDFAKEYADEVAPANGNITGVTARDINEYISNAVKDTVEFAQLWISVDEELPEESGFYLVKSNSRFSGFGICFLKKLKNKSLKWIGTREVTHWRYIELK
jgi:hypothetical protein